VVDDGLVPSDGPSVAHRDSTELWRTGSEAVNAGELEARLEGGCETQSLEVKASMPWEVSKLAKDILALSNVRDGGYIVIGIEDGTFTRQGVDSSTRDSYRVDVMRDQMAAYADPHVLFSVDYPKDRNGLEFVVIRVEPFEQLPVICRKDGHDVKAGVIYYRNLNKRPQSAAVSNSYDVREIVTLAAVRMRQQLAILGARLEAVSPDNKFDEELGGL
jgi:predicted HTH transcriptional regulator